MRNLTLRDPSYMGALSVAPPPLGLSLRFADTKSLIDLVSGQNLITFTRASSATYIDSDGAMKVAAVNVPRFDHDPTTGESLGLLVEEQRTNLLLNSATLSTQNVTVTAAAHTLSFTGTGTVTLSGTSTAGPLVGIGTGEANRVSLTFTPTAGTLTLTVSGTVSSAQLEQGGFRTSYIPTTTATATRSADVTSISGANFSSWYRQDEGTIFCDAKEYPFTSSVSRVFYDISNSASGNNNFIRQWIWIGNTSVVRASIYTTNSGPIAAEFNTSVINEQKRIALAIRANDFAFAYNGGAVSVDTAGNMAVGVNRIFIGLADSVSYLNGYIRRIDYWPQRLPNSMLRAVTL